MDVMKKWGQSRLTPEAAVLLRYWMEWTYQMAPSKRKKGSYLKT